MRSVLLAIGAFLVSCGSSPQEDFELPDALTDSGPEVTDTGAAEAPPTLVGLGGPCDATNKCRDGLVCDPTTSKCVGAGTAKEGDPCAIGPECASGMCGPKRTCDPAGSGVEGGGCAGDGDCASGLRCLFDGSSIVPVCVRAGTGDAGSMCASTRDCAQGMFCTGGACQQVPFPTGDPPAHGIPPFIPDPTKKLWAGAECPAPIKSGAITALFQVPRSTDAAHSDFYRLPFPNDAARVGGKVSFANHPHDASSPVGFDVLARYFSVLESEPFGAYSTVYFRFDGEFDFGSVSAGGDDPILRYVDLTTGSRRGFSYFVTNGRNQYICPNYIAVRPNRGDVFQAGHTYAVILKTGVTGTDKTTRAKPADDFAKLIAATAPIDAALSEPYAAYKPLRDYLTAQKIATTDVLNATVFTVGDPRAIAARLRTSARAATAPSATSWTKCDTGVKSPCPQADGDRACAAADPAYDEWHALVSLPIYQRGDAPYDKGGDFDLTGTGAITAARTEQVCLSLTVPKSTAPTGGFPVAIYAHGTGGSFRSHVIDGTAKRLAKIDLGGTTTAFAVLGIDQVAHGPRRGSSTREPRDIFFNFGNPLAARFGPLQGAADQHALVRLVETLTVTGASFDPTKIVFFGHSQGSTEGAMFLAYDQAIKGAVFSGQGASLLDALVTKKAPIDLSSLTWILLSETSPTAVDAWHPALSLLQWWEDPADPLHFAAATTRLPRNVLMTFGTKDTYTPHATQVTFLAAAGLAFVGSDLETFGGTPLASAQGNIDIGGVKATAVVRQYAPGAYDGHFVAFENDTARADITKFLARVARGELPRVPE